MEVAKEWLIEIFKQLLLVFVRDAVSWISNKAVQCYFLGILHCQIDFDIRVSMICGVKF